MEQTIEGHLLPEADSMLMTVTMAKMDTRWLSPSRSRCRPSSWRPTWKPDAGWQHRQKGAWSRMGPLSHCRLFLDTSLTGAQHAWSFTFHPWRLSSVVAVEVMLPAKLETFTAWPFLKSLERLGRRSPHFVYTRGSWAVGA